MELYQLEYVIALDKYKSFSKAANSINVSQSAFSYGIKKIEEQLGIKLFARNRKHVCLTPAGKEFIVYAKNIINEVENAQNAMLRHANSYKGIIRIGAIQALSYQGITNILGKFQKQFPEIRMEITEGDSCFLIEKFNLLELDAIFINSIHLPEEYKSHSYPLYEDKLVFLVSKLHDIAKKECVDLSQLSQETFVLVTGFLDDFIKLCLSVGFKPSITSISSRSLIVKKFVEQNLGIAPCTFCVANSLLNNNVKIVNFLPLVKRTTYLIIKNTSPINLIFKDYILANIN